MDKEVTGASTEVQGETWVGTSKIRRHEYPSKYVRENSGVPKVGGGLGEFKNPPHPEIPKAL